MDQTDYNIINVLNSNARNSYRDIAKKLNISLSTVANRIKKMEKETIINGYIPIINQEKIGLDLTVIISLRISHGKLIEVQQKISNDKHVFAVYDVTGDWDSFILAHFKDRRDLNMFIKRVLSIEDVERTNTQIVLNTVKEEKRIIIS